MPPDTNATPGPEVQIRRLTAILGLEDGASADDVLGKLGRIVDTLGLADDEGGKAFLARAASLLTQTSESRRQQVINSSIVDLRTHKKRVATVICSDRAWVDDSLREAGMSPLSDAEAQRVEILVH